MVLNDIISEKNCAVTQIIDSQIIKRWFNGKLAVLDITESGRQIGEKLILLLDERQREELAQCLLESSMEIESESIVSCSKHILHQNSPLTEIWEGNLYLCLEQRLVKVREQEVVLTAKEFDILFLLSSNPNRVFTYELIMDLVWNEDYTYYSRKAINNHVSNLRKKLKTEPDDPDYIKSVTGIGYKFAPP